jgi:hypothetical protein
MFHDYEYKLNMANEKDKEIKDLIQKQSINSENLVSILSKEQINDDDNNTKTNFHLVINTYLNRISNTMFIDNYVRPR